MIEPLPPHDDPAERALLGSILIDRNAFEEVKPLIRVDSFYSADNQIIYRVALEMLNAGKPIDGLLLRSELEKRKLLDEIGGIPYLAQILDSVPSSAHAAYYAAVVVQKAKYRSIIQSCNDAMRAASSEAVDPVTISRRLEAEAMAIREFGFSETIVPVGETTRKALLSKKNNEVTRIKTWLMDLDDVCGGIPIGCQTLVGGLPGMGKSQLTRQILKNIAQFGDVPVGLISIEESAMKIGENTLANESGVENNRIVYNRNLTEDEFRRLEEADASMQGVPWYIDDAQRRISSIEASVRRMVKKFGCKVIGVDHLHLIDGENHIGSPEREISLISAGLKHLWKELNVAGIVAVQLNRAGAQDSTAAPELRHMKGSGSLEADGDLIFQLHRPDYFRWKESNYTPDHCLKCFINKNKGGPVGLVDLWFDGDMQFVGNWNFGRGPFAPAVAADPFA